MRVAVVGLGKIGLPLAVQFASKGHRVRGCDINSDVVKTVNDGTTPDNAEHGLAELLAAVVAEGLLTATTDTTDAVALSDVVVMVVPLAVDHAGLPDFRHLDSATEAVARGLRPGTLVSYETTLPVGTTRDRWTPALSIGSGLTPGRDLFVSFSPERVFTGRVFADLRRYPKLIGGIDAASSTRAVDFYTAVLDFDERADLDQENGVWDLGSSEAAELAKLAETTYRDVNIGLANQFARFADFVGIDFHKVLAACNSQPFSHLHRPGIAVGGHCIPVYPRLYLWGDPTATIVEAARTANLAMPSYAIDVLEHHLGPVRGCAVVVLGAAYRGGVKETAFSGVFATVSSLRTRGATAVVHDPLYSDDELIALGLAPYAFGQPVDAAVIQTDHDLYREIGPAQLPGVRVLVDGRAITNIHDWPGVQVASLGRAALS